MTSDRQTHLINQMQNAEFYPHETNIIRVVETHISMVILTGSYVYKLKKPVEMGFLDFSTLDQRKFFCEREVALNRRLAEDVYMGVVPITLDGDDYVCNGSGEPVEYAVQMRQLPEDATMDSLLRGRGTLPAGKIDLLAECLSKFYGEADAGDDIDRLGSWEMVRHNCEENFTQIADVDPETENNRLFRIIRAAMRSFLRKEKGLFDKRVSEGKIKDGHGDLRGDHIYFTADGVRVIDCIEFNDRFRYGDIASELAFLAMELDFSGHSRTAREVLKRYADISGDSDFFSLLPFYQCYRAMVRIKVNSLRLNQSDTTRTERRDIRDQSGRYIDLAYQYARQFIRPTLWIICGVIGSGKTTIAGTLADILDIPCIHSDVVRKTMFSNSMPSSDQQADFMEGIYSPAATALTYGSLLRSAHDEIKRGGSVILDATFSDEKWRNEAIRLAEDTDAELVFVECRAKKETLAARLAHREHTSPVSDARKDILEDFLNRYDALSDVSPHAFITIDTECPVDENMRHVLSYHLRTDTNLLQ